MTCPHCEKAIDWDAVLREIRQALMGLSESAQPLAGTMNERAKIIDWLASWRKANGLPAVYLKGRSIEQLRKMSDEAQAGKQYRTGRTWKVKQR